MVLIAAVSTDSGKYCLNGCSEVTRYTGSFRNIELARLGEVLRPRADNLELQGSRLLNSSLQMASRNAATAVSAASEANDVRCHWELGLALNMGLELIV